MTRGSRHSLSRKLSIGELETASGLKRSTIYFYTREGLIPPPQKLGRGRGIYGEQHVASLAEITHLKESGLSLDQIRSRIKQCNERLPPEDVDLVAEHLLETRAAILNVATRHFASKGFRGTRVMDIIEELGMPPLIFYRYFPTKRELYLETVDRFSDLMVKHIEGQLEGEEDVLRRAMLRVRGYLGIQSVFPDMLTFVKAEAMTHGDESRAQLRKTYAKLLTPAQEDLKRLGREHENASSHEDELLSYALMGVLEATGMRVFWDKKYSVADYYWVNLEVTLGFVERYITGKDLRKDPKYAQLVDDLVSGELPVPAEFGLPVPGKSQHFGRPRPARHISNGSSRGRGVPPV